jgi:hypothetical protein
MFSNLITDAIWQRRSRRYPADQVVNAFDTPAVIASITPPSQAPADAVRAAWLAAEAHQAVPMLGEDVVYQEPFWDE